MCIIHLQCLARKCNKQTLKFGKSFMIRYVIFAISFWVGTVRSLTPEEIDGYVKETLHNWQIAGLALAVIQNGQEAYV